MRECLGKQCRGMDALVSFMLLSKHERDCMWVLSRPLTTEALCSNTSVRYEPFHPSCMLPLLGITLQCAIVASCMCPAGMARLFRCKEYAPLTYRMACSDGATAANVGLVTGGDL